VGLLQRTNARVLLDAALSPDDAAVLPPHARAASASATALASRMVSQIAQLELLVGHNEADRVLSLSVVRLVARDPLTGRPVASEAFLTAKEFAQLRRGDGLLRWDSLMALQRLVLGWERTGADSPSASPSAPGSGGSSSSSSGSSSGGGSGGGVAKSDGVAAGRTGAEATVACPCAALPRANGMGCGGWRGPEPPYVAASIEYALSAVCPAVVVGMWGGESGALVP